MATDSGIDPRYAAQFQRGFDPARHAVAPPPEPRGPVRIQGGPPPAVHRVPDPPRIGERPAVDRFAPPAVHAREHPPAEPDSGDDVDEFAEPPVLRRTWALPAVGAALLVVAALLFTSSVTDTGLYNGSTNQTDYVWSNIRLLLPGPLFVASTLTFTAWLVARGLSAGDSR